MLNLDLGQMRIASLKTLLLILVSLAPLSFAYGASDYLKTYDQVTAAATAAHEAQKGYRNGTASPDPFAPFTALVKQGLGLDSKEIPLQTTPVAPIKQAAPLPKSTQPTVKPAPAAESGISGVPNNDEQQNNNDNNVQLNF
ncbi:MAG: hypothetical protein K0R12_919 [Gammaproteobacteria bacterium]|nr:hypothetical protein [Gammaproteobacteria bacterium]